MTSLQALWYQTCSVVGQGVLTHVAAAKYARKHVRLGCCS
jgi:hypothetical protein